MKNMNINCLRVPGRKRLNSAGLVSRIAAAIFGGYVLAALTSVAALILPIARPQAVLTGMLASFLVYVLTVIWVFAVRSAVRAWTGIFILAILLGIAALLV